MGIKNELVVNFLAFIVVTSWLVTSSVGTFESIYQPIVGCMLVLIVLILFLQTVKCRVFDQTHEEGFLELEKKRKFWELLKVGVVNKTYLIMLVMAVLHFFVSYTQPCSLLLLSNFYLRFLVIIVFVFFVYHPNSSYLFNLVIVISIIITHEISFYFIFKYDSDKLQYFYTRNLALMIFFYLTIILYQLESWQMYLNISKSFSKAQKKLKINENVLQDQKSHSLQLMHSIVPPQLAVKVIESHWNQKVEKKLGFRDFFVSQVDNVSILFADIVGFTKMSSNKTAESLVEILDDLFGRSVHYLD